MVIRDNPALFWLFYSIFPAMGGGLLYLTWTQPPDQTAFVIASAIGFSHVAGGAYMLWKEPASVVEIDRLRGWIDVRRWGLSGRRAQRLLADAISGAEVEIGEHSEGGAIYRPSLTLRSGERVPVSLFWYQTEDESAMVAERINAALNRASSCRPPSRRD